MPWMRDSRGGSFMTGTRAAGPPPGPAPTLTSLSPDYIHLGAPTTVVVTGTGFSRWSKVWADEAAQNTTYVSPTELTYWAQADQVGSQTITVHDPNGTSEAIELQVEDNT